MFRPAALVVLGSLAFTAAAQAAGDPIMPLDQVRQGMQCTVASVVHGTDVATFTAVVDDVIAGGSDPSAARVIVTVSGPAIDATGVGPGFSGSPVSCPGPDGSPRIIGAISETIGAYGGKTVLVTPIQAIIGEPVDPPHAATTAASRARAAALLRSARPISEPLSFSGLSPALGSALERAARRAGRVLISAPARARQALATAPLRPGSAMAVSLSTGDVSAGAIGTVAYVDGDTIWSFGHPFDGVGRRNLFLSGAYVYAVVNNPVGTEEASTYKLAAPTESIGTLTEDGISAVVGRRGALPPSFPLKVNTRDLDTGRKATLRAQVADERSIGLPTGVSALTTVAAPAAAQAVYNAFDGSPARQSDELCLRIAVRQRPKPLGFCNTYVGAGGGIDALLGGPLVGDVGAATQILDLYDATSLDVTGVTANVKVSRGLRLATLAKLSGAPAVRRGSDLVVHASLLRPGGGTLTRTFKVHVPAGIPAGPRDLLLKGTAPDAGGGSSDTGTATIDISSLFEPAADGTSGPANVKELAQAVAELHRYDGVTSRWLPPGADAPEELPGGAEGVAQRSRRVYRDPQVRIAGLARLEVIVRP